MTQQPEPLITGWRVATEEELDAMREIVRSVGTTYEEAVQALRAGCAATCLTPAVVDDEFDAEEH